MGENACARRPLGARSAPARTFNHSRAKSVGPTRRPHRAHYVPTLWKTVVGRNGWAAAVPTERPLRAHYVFTPFWLKTVDRTKRPARQHCVKERWSKTVGCDIVEPTMCSRRAD